MSIVVVRSSLGIVNLIIKQVSSDITIRTVEYLHTECTLSLHIFTRITVCYLPKIKRLLKFQGLSCPVSFAKTSFQQVIYFLRFRGLLLSPSKHFCSCSQCFLMWFTGKDPHVLFTTEQTTYSDVSGIKFSKNFVIAMPNLKAFCGSPFAIHPRETLKDFEIKFSMFCPNVCNIYNPCLIVLLIDMPQLTSELFKCYSSGLGGKRNIWNNLYFRVREKNLW